MSAGADGALRFDVITLFPELFAPFLEAGVARRAYASGQIELKLWNPRDYADGNYRRVDDRPFGGGPVDMPAEAVSPVFSLISFFMRFAINVADPIF